MIHLSPGNISLVTHTSATFVAVVNSTENHTCLVQGVAQRFPWHNVYIILHLFVSCFREEIINKLQSALMLR